MIDKKTTQLLNSPKAEDRKQAVKALAQSNQAEALKYLATIYKTDSDPEIRDLALKAGRYLKKKLDSDGGTSAPAPIEKARSEAPAEQVPARVSQLDQERANGLLQFALEQHMRGADSKAAKSLEEAFSLNPHLLHDQYAVGLASTVTGLPGEEAVARLSHAAARGHKRISSMQAAAQQSTPAHRALALVMVLSALIMLIAYLLMPWADLGLVETVDEFGESISLSQQIEEARQQIDDLQALVALQGGNASIVNEFAAAVNALNFDFSGLEVTAIVYNLSDPLEIMGVTGLFRSLSRVINLPFDESEFRSPPVESDPLDYTMLFVPLVSIVIIVIGVLLLSGRSAALMRWGLCMLFGVIVVIPFVWFYMDVSGGLLSPDANLGELGQITAFEPVSLIAVGYWTALIGMIGMLLMPLIAFILPQPKNKRKIETEAEEAQPA